MQDEVKRETDAQASLCSETKQVFLVSTYFPGAGGKTAPLVSGFPVNQTLNFSQT